MNGTRIATRLPVRCELNGRPQERDVDVRITLADWLRDELQLTGTKLGCEHGVCGACTVLVDGKAVRSCLMLAVQAGGRSILTVEGLSAQSSLNPLQSAFQKHHALQCGFCTAGFLMTCTAFLNDNPHPTKVEIREAISGNLCRCTGYQTIIEAVADVAGHAEARQQ